MLTIPQQAGADGRLFGSVTAQDIADAIRDARGLKIDKRNVHLEEPIKNVGTYMVVVEVAEGVDGHRQDHGRRAKKLRRFRSATAAGGGAAGTWRHGGTRSVRRTRARAVEGDRVGHRQGVAPSGSSGRRGAEQARRHRTGTGTGTGTGADVATPGHRFVTPRHQFFTTARSVRQLRLHSLWGRC